MKPFTFLVAVVSLLMCRSFSLAQDASPSSPEVDHESVVVNAKLPSFKVDIERTAPDEVTIRISGGPKGYPGQTFQADIYGEDIPEFNALDVNFDGYMDFSLVTDRGKRGNVSYEYWIFDPKMVVFEEAEGFDGINDVDPVHHLLFSDYGLGNIDRVEKTYRLKDGKPELIETVEVEYASAARDVVPASYADDAAVQITCLYRNGKLSRTFYTDKPSAFSQ